MTTTSKHDAQAAPLSPLSSLSPSASASASASERLRALEIASAGIAAADALAAIDSDWDDAALFEVVALPSGKRVQVQPVSLLSMIANKSLPNTLMAAARRSAGLNGQAAAEPSEEDAQDGMQLIDFMVCAMCVRPHFVMQATAECGPGERSVYAMWDTDKTFLFNRAMQGQQALKSPRPERPSGRSDRAGADVEATAE